MGLLANGGRPVHLQSPIIEEVTWKLMQDCWKAIPSERPTMALIVKRLVPLRTFRPLITFTALNKVYCIAISRH